jgi:hypothetical protein
MREQQSVHYALSQIGFVGISPMDWIYQSGEVTCAVPWEATATADAAVRFLLEGAFQNTLQKQTRLLYYRLADQLARCLNMKGSHERQDPKQRLS